MGTALGFGTVVHSRQVHGTRVLYHGTGSDSGADDDYPSRAPQELGRPHRANLFLGAEADGHLSRKGGVLFGVTVADCVPVFLVDPVSRVVGLLHAGWRGAVAGVLEAALEDLGGALGVDLQDLHMHLGPSICRDCFEVGPEVQRAMGLPDSDGARPVDLRGYLAGCGAGAGMAPGRITESAWCTLCDGSPFFSHRRGERGRQVGFLGVRAGEESDPVEWARGR